MTVEALDKRVTRLESHFEKMQADVTEVKVDLHRVSTDIGRVYSDVGKLLKTVEEISERDASRPEALSWKAIAATCAGIAATGYVVWWLISTAPAVQDLRERMMLLDNRDVGYIRSLSERVQKLEEDRAWAPKITSVK